MSFKKLREANLLRVKLWHSGGVDDWSLSDWMTVATGELGEAANVIKKLNCIRDGLTGNKPAETVEALRRDLAYEIADTMIYLDLLAARARIDLESAVVEKFNIVSDRNNFPIYMEKANET